MLCTYRGYTHWEREREKKLWFYSKLQETIDSQQKNCLTVGCNNSKGGNKNEGLETIILKLETKMKDWNRWWVKTESEK